jgi:hypothetical protein
LRDCWRRLRRSAIALHPDRPGFGLGAVGLTHGLLGAFARALGMDLGSADATIEKDLAGFGAHGRRLEKNLPVFGKSFPYRTHRERPGKPLGIEVWNGPEALQVREVTGLANEG